MHVLVVDDDEAFCQLLVKILQSNGMEAEWTSDGLSACEKTLRQPYDLFIFDVRMPLVLGTELAEGLKKERPDAKVILISSFADEALQETAAHLGVSLLSKPFTLNRLLQTTTEVLRENT
jgi:DNA-binding response OmpR family regulator